MSMEAEEQRTVRVRLETQVRNDPNTRQPTVHIIATPKRFRVREGERLIFGCNHPFTVDFVDADPLAGELEQMSVDPSDWPGNEPEDEISYVLGQQVRPDTARPERYKYSVSLYYGGQVYSVDPEGVVEPDPKKKAGSN